MRVSPLVVVTAVGALALSQGALAVDPLPPAIPPGTGQLVVEVNSQESLVEAVGAGFHDEAWEYPEGLIPDAFPGFVYVSGPGDAESPMAAWRKPVVLRCEESNADVAVNCYRIKEKRAGNAASGKPFASLLEPDFRYSKAEFHGLRSAWASEAERDVFVYREGATLFKVEATGANPQARKKASSAVAEKIWNFAHQK